MNREKDSKSQELVMCLNDWLKQFYPDYYDKDGNRLYRIDADEGTMRTEDDTYGIMTSR